MRNLIAAALQVIGCALFVSGIAVISWQFALVVAGVIVVGFGVAVERAA